MKRPSIQFYVGDWQGNTKLRRCSHAEKGVWVDVMCLMHDSEEYGVLRWPLKDIAQAAGCKAADLRALQIKGVLKGADLNESSQAFIYTPRHAGKDGESVILVKEQNGPIWYSSRMVVDEYVRIKKGNASLYTASPHYTPKGGLGELSGVEPKGGFGDLPSSSSSSSSSKESNTTKKKQYSDLFQLGWEIYPSGRKGNKDKTYLAWIEAVKRASEEVILNGIKAYAVSESAKTHPKGFAAWLNDDRWAWDYTDTTSGKKGALPKVPSPLREVV